ncbi:MAG: hypothetical protein GF381_03230 [Candidatus Pacebacteria bacterium]|nr:hypothetical protein [Candidatus Paceibacterota bacterium]
MAKRRVSSRLAKKESAKLTKQAIMLILLSLGVVALFVFVVVPNVIRLFFSVIDSSSPFEQTDNIPPQPPVISSPVSATSSAKLKIKGYGEPESEVVFVINNDRQKIEEVDQDGQFESLVSLSEGQNTLSLYSIDRADNESIAKRYQILVDTQAPELVVDHPQDGAKFELEKNQVVEIRGLTESGAKVYINGRLSMANDEGVFAQRYRLSEGENKLEIRAVDQAGNQTTQELTVSFEE